jgi:hypothetical protein
MKITKTQLQEIIKEAFKNGFFQEITEEMLDDDVEMDHLLRAFLPEIRIKRVVRGKKLFKKRVCPNNKRYVPALKKCVTKTATEKAKKRRAMRRAAMKKRGKKAMIARKRRKSMKKRKAFGLGRR